MLKEVALLTLCDADPDRERFGAPTVDSCNGPLVWKGFEEGLPYFLKAIQELKDAQGKSPRITWCIRSDEQIKACMGQYDACFSQFDAQIQKWRDRGDEIGWHPHTWRFNEKASKWYQEIEDQTWMESMYRKSFDSIQSHLDSIKVIKMGWCYLDNFILKTLCDLGINVETSGMPMQSYSPPLDEYGLYMGRYQWSETQNRCYEMDLNHYQKEKRGSGVFEVPISAASSYWISFIERSVMAMRRRSLPNFFQKATPVSLKITFPPFIFKSIWKSFLKELKKMERPFVHTYFHPDECLPKNDDKARQLSTRNAVLNFKLMLDDLNRLGYTPRYQGLGEWSRERLDE